MSLKIGIYIPTLSGGGAQRAALNLAEGFLGNDCQASLILVKAQGPLMDDIPSGANVINLNAYRTVSSIPKLSLHLRQVEYDVVISMMNYVNICAVAANIMAGNPARLILVEQNTISRTFQKLNYRQRAVRRTLTQFLYPQADYVTAVSQGAALDLEELTGLNDVRTIYNPISVVSDFSSLKSPESIHPWFGKSDSVVLGAGLLTEQKGFPTLIRAFRHIRDEGRACRLIIIGEREEKDKLEALIRDLNLENVVSLPGFADNPYEYMRAADVFALSSRWEGFGNVLVEAMACGTPVVSTDCPYGPAEILQNGRWGHLVPVNDNQALAHAIIDTLEAPLADADDLVERSKDFAPKKIAKQYLSLIDPEN
jgi:glycosyltransferase involved in cell wall biosynthesis